MIKLLYVVREQLYLLKECSKVFLRALFKRHKEPEDKVSFMVVGAQKAGTTSLDKYLRLHPGLDMPIKKELRYFNNPFFFLTRIKTYKSYHSLFKGKGGLKGEVTPDYVDSAEILGRVYDYNSNLKIVMVLRDPVERAFSQWNMEVQRKRENRPFSEAIRDEKASYDVGMGTRFSYLSRGLYGSQINLLFGLFGRDRTKVIFSDELRLSPQLVMDEVYSFLGVERLQIETLIEEHKRDYSARILDEDREYLGSFYAEDVDKLEALLGKDLSSWKSVL